MIDRIRLKQLMNSKHKYWIIAVWILCTVNAVFVAWWKAADGQNAPRSGVVFDELRHDFGDVRVGAELTHEFKYTNSGTIPLRLVRVKTTCGCLVGRSNRRILEPGESNVIRVSLNTHGIRPPHTIRKTVTASFSTDEKSLFSRTFAIEAQIFPEILVSPKRLEFNLSNGGNSSTATLAIFRKLLSSEAFRTLRIHGEEYFEIAEQRRTRDEIEFNVQLRTDVSPSSLSSLVLEYEQGGEINKIYIPTFSKRNRVHFTPSAYVTTVNTAMSQSELKTATLRTIFLNSNQSSTLIANRITAKESRDGNSFGWDVNRGDAVGSFRLWLRYVPTEKPGIYSAVFWIFCRDTKGRDHKLDFDARVLIRDG